MDWFLILSTLSIVSAQHSAALTHISSLSVTSHIALRYAQTEVETLIKNPDNSPRDVEFSLILPDSAFISFFSMTAGDGEQVAEVLAKEAAVEKFNNAKKLGIGAGLVSENERDSNKFSISTIVEGGEKVVFKLKYEELLQRRNGQYEHTININPEGVVEDLKVEVFINESLPISNLFVPELKVTNEVSFAREAKNKDAKVSHKPGTTDAHIVFAPDKAAQRAAGESGVHGQFMVRYDVDRKGQDNEVQVIDGYFVHFFAPDNLQKLPKHAVFVLDISGSMMGEKIVQLKDAMFTILDDMTEADFFSIIVFSSGVQTWTSNELERLEKDESGDPVVIKATEHNKNIAISYVNSLSEGGSTNINAAMLEGIELAEMATKKELLPMNTKSMVIFMTDGMPSVGERNSKNIRQNVKNRNINKIPIFGLAFGRDSDFNLMKEISSDADSFAKRIYEGSDAAIQLEDFFSQISSPLISELQFDYLGDVVNKSSLSKANINSFFKGGEYVVVGKLNNNLDRKEDKLSIVLLGEKYDGKYERKLDICLRPRALPVNSPLPALPSNPLDHPFPSTCIPPPQLPERSAEQKFMQKLHAFVNIKQLLKRDDTELSGGEEPRAKALRLALANNFVTELTSLVVVAKQEVTIAYLESKASSSSRYSPMLSYSFPTQARSAGMARSYSRSYSHAQSGGISAHSLSPQSALSSGWLSSQSAPSYAMKSSSSSSSDIAHGIIPLPRTRTRHYNSRRLPIARSDRLNNPPPKAEKKETPPTTTVCSGTISLYSKTYHRGSSVTLTEDTEDLGLLHFADRLVSLSVEGDCCWEVWTGIAYSGDRRRFNSNGTYLSTTSVGNLFRNAKSVKKC